MTGILHLALRYLAFNKAKTSIMVACVTATLSLPAVMHVLVRQFQEELGARAAATPLVIGAKGSRFDLALHAMYFEAQPPAETAMREVATVRSEGDVTAIPLLVRYRAQDAPIVGTTREYYDLRSLTLAAGDPLDRIGDCVLGARAAARIGVGPGDRLLSDPDNLFDFAGSYPLSMRVRGVLHPSNSPDDDGVFVDIETAWVIAGIGHGHPDLPKDPDDEDLPPEQADAKHRALASTVSFTEITDENAEAFHFHDSSDDFPITAIIAVPDDEMAGTLLMGRYLSPDASAQVIEPNKVIDDLMQMVFRVQRFFNVVTVVMAVVTVLFLVLVTSLSIRLRRGEMETMFKLGCSRFTVLWLLAVEIAIIVSASLLLAGSLTITCHAAAPTLLRLWLF